MLKMFSSLKLRTDPNSDSMPSRFTNIVKLSNVLMEISLNFDFYKTHTFKTSQSLDIHDLKPGKTLLYLLVMLLISPTGI